MGLPIYTEAPDLSEKVEPMSFHWWSAIWMNTRKALFEIRDLFTWKDSTQPLLESQQERIEKLETQVEALLKKKAGK
jgi:hypothetical protein